MDSLVFFHGFSGLFSMDSLDFYHGFSGLFPWILWTFTMDSLDFFHGFSGLLPWILWMFSKDSLDFYHGLSGQSGQCPGKHWKMSTESRWTGQCPWTKSQKGLWTQLTVWITSRETLENVQGIQVDWTLSMDKVPEGKSRDSENSLDNVQ